VRRLTLIISLLGTTALSGCTQWSDFGQGGAAEDLPDSVILDQDSAFTYASHELRQDFDYIRQHLDVLILRGAQRCFPASVYTASLGENRVARELAGGLIDDAEISLLDLRFDLQRLEQKLDAIANADSCWEQDTGAVPETAQQIGENTSTAMVADASVLSEFDAAHLSALLNSDNQFAYGSEQINPKYEQNLVAACTALKQKPGVGLRVTGHADASGNSDQNAVLSSRRAMTTVNFLISCGIDAERIKLSFEGDKQPQYSGRSPAIDLVNRRVSIELDIDSAGNL
jgi:outer membrane protein OmpA-like peptidoglycan-associated protein